jgi:ABC-type transport system substrate-binding protein
MLISLLAIIPLIPMASAQQPGPMSDILRGKVITSPDAALLAMMTDEADVSPDQIRTTDIETQISAGFLVTSNRGFHMGYIAYNIRADQSYRRDLGGQDWPLADPAFRHALIHGYDQLGIIPPIYGYIVTPVRSLVPPAQAYWYNPNTPPHPFALGDPVTSPAGEHSTCGVLKAAGYTYDDRGTGDTADDRWKDPDGLPLPQMVIWTPLESIAPTSWEHGQEFGADLGTIGLKATTANGNSGILPEGADFNWYLAKVFDESDFDGYMVFWGLGRAPDQMYLLTHSDFDTMDVPGSYNAPGIDDPDLDDLLETMMFTLPPAPGDPDPRRDACFEAQYRLYDPAYGYSLAYMLLYSRNYFNAFDQDLHGVVKSPGYGSDNGWTWLNAYFDPTTGHMEGGKSVINYIVGEKPESHNPTYASTVYEWFYIGGTQDGLMSVNPWNHYDVDWIATDWELVETGVPATPMEITYTLRSDVEWQDGHPFTAYDCNFTLTS